MSGYFLIYNDEHHQVLQAASEQFAIGSSTISTRSSGRRRIYRCGDSAPNALEIVSIMKTGSPEKAAVAIQAYPGTTKRKKPVNRAKDAFEEAFGYRAKSPTELKALSLIVQYASPPEENDDDD